MTLLASTRQSLSVLVVDDDRAVAAMIADAFATAGFETACAASGEEALEAARRDHLDAAVVDVCLPGMSGFGVCHALRELFGLDFPIVFVSGERTESYDRVGGLLAGADDYLVKPFAPDELVLRLTTLLRRRVQPARHDGVLTQREHEVLALLASGLEARAIADRLVISPKTVDTHIERILLKLNVHSRTQAVAVAFRDELVSL